MSWDFMYSVEGFVPQAEMSMAGFGFLALLDRDYARKALSTEMPETVRGNLQSMGEYIIKNSGLEPTLFMQKPYHFVENSYLLQFCSSPGDACDLGMEINQLELLREELTDPGVLEQSRRFDNPITYLPHNVDSPLQAYTLFALWANWANGLRFLDSA